MVLLNGEGSHIFVDILQLFSSYALSSPLCHILFQGNVASQSFTLDIAQLKNLLYSLLRKVLAHLSTVHVCLFKSDIYKV